MHNNEWSLIGFTLISQLSVGLVLLFGSLNLFNLNEQSQVWWKSPEILILFLIIIASVISLLHLGKPINAPNSIQNLSLSWISREILMLGVFSFSVFLLFLFNHIFESSALFKNALYIFSAIAGIAFIYSMSGIYLIETVPSWNSVFTPINFFASVTMFLILGLFYLNHSSESILSMNKVNILVLIFIVLQIFIALMHYRYLNGLESRGIENISFDKGTFYILFLARIIFLILVIIPFLINIIFSGVIHDNKIIFVSILVILLSQEVIGRLLFYQSYFRLGM